MSVHGAMTSMLTTHTLTSISGLTAVSHAYILHSHLFGQSTTPLLHPAETKAPFSYPSRFRKQAL